MQPRVTALFLTTFGSFLWALLAFEALFSLFCSIVVKRPLLPRVFCYGQRMQCILICGMLTHVPVGAKTCGEHQCRQDK